MFNLKWSATPPVVGLAACVAFVAWLYIPSLQNGLVWDDVWYLRGEPAYRIPSLWINALSEHFLYFVNYYRPAVIASFLIDSHLLGATDAVFHGTNLFVHLLSVVIFYGLSRELFLRAGAGAGWALLASFLYGCSPIVSEVVLWVSGRFDLFLTCFVLLLLLVDIKLKGRTRYILIFFMYFLAACSKEMAVTVVLFYPLWHWVIARLDNDRATLRQVFQQRRNVLAYVAVFFAGLCYLAVRHYALGGLFVHEQVGVTSDQSGSALLLILKTIGGYVHVTCSFSSNISPVYPMPDPLVWMDVEVWVGIVFLTSIFFLWWFDSTWWGVFTIFCVALIPVLHVIPLSISGNYMHLRFLTLPFTLVILLGLPLLSRYSFGVPRAKMAVLTLVFGMVCVEALTVRSLIPMWHSNLSLWTWTNKHYPNYYMASLNLAGALADQGHYEKSIAMSLALLNSGVERAHRASIYFSLAKSYYHLNEIVKMEEFYIKIFSENGDLDLRPTQYSRIYTSLASSLMETTPQNPSIGGLIEQAVRLNPYNGNAWFLKGVDAYKSGNYSEAKKFIKLSLTLVRDSRRSILEAVLRDKGMSVLLQEQ